MDVVDVDGIVANLSDLYLTRVSLRMNKEKVEFENRLKQHAHHVQRYEDHNLQAKALECVPVDGLHALAHSDVEGR